MVTGERGNPAPEKEKKYQVTSPDLIPRKCTEGKDEYYHDGPPQNPLILGEKRRKTEVIGFKEKLGGRGGREGMWQTGGLQS